jgi:hypothetical protein
MVTMLGNEEVEKGHRYHVENILYQLNDDPDLPDVLIDHLGDERVFDAAKEVPSGNGEKSSYSVGDECREILAAMMGINPRSPYRVGNWRDWWAAHRNKSFRDIREEVKGAEAKLKEK